MIVYEVSVNQHLVRAGAPDQTSLSLRLNSGEGFSSPQLSVSAFRVSDQRLEKHYHWEFRPLSLGDTVTIRVLDDSSADPPTNVDAARSELTTDEKALARHEIAKLRRARAARESSLANREGTGQGLEQPTTLYCSFCGRSQHEVKKLIAGPAVYICDACIADCVKLQEES